MAARLFQTKQPQGSSWLPLPPLARPKTPALKPKLTSEMNISAPQNWTPEGPSMTCGSDPGSQAYPHLSHVQVPQVERPSPHPGGHSGLREDGDPPPRGQQLMQNPQDQGQASQRSSSSPSHCPLAPSPVSTCLPFPISHPPGPKRAGGQYFPLAF